MVSKFISSSSGKLAHSFLCLFYLPSSAWKRSGRHQLQLVSGSFRGFWWFLRALTFCSLAAESVFVGLGSYINTHTPGGSAGCGRFFVLGRLIERERQKSKHICSHAR